MLHLDYVGFTTGAVNRVSIFCDLHPKCMRQINAWALFADVIESSFEDSFRNLDQIHKINLGA